MLRARTSGSYRSTERFLAKMIKDDITSQLDKYGQIGVNALSQATPKESGFTSERWFYKVNTRFGRYSIEWHNDHIVDGVPIAIILQYGHGTGTGGYVEGRDYINAAIKPVMDQIALDVWKVVTSA